MAAALNIEDLHIARGWCAFYNHFKWNFLSWTLFVLDRLQGQPDNVQKESHAYHTPRTIRRLPLVLGREFCGEVIDVSSDLMYTYPVGSKVVGYLKPHQSGALSECIYIPAFHCAPLPTNISPIEGAALPFAAHYIMTTLFAQQDDRNPINQMRKFFHERKYLKREDLEHKNVLIIGIGGIGSLLVQIVSAMGASVDIVCSKEATKLAYKLKANNIFDYEEYDYKDDLVEKIKETTNGEKYSAVFDCSRATSIEESSVSWIGQLIDRNDTVVVGFNSPENAIKDGQPTLLGIY